jgi:T-complex protein 1 subunit gamma
VRNSLLQAVADIIRTTLGPRSMLKMLLDPMGGIVITNDGNAILREIDVTHPAAKSMIELSRSQDEEVGDGTTSVIILGKLKNPDFSNRASSCFGSPASVVLPLAECRQDSTNHCSQDAATTGLERGLSLECG